jgi:autotransporter-associated beta strand protein
LASAESGVRIESPVSTAIIAASIPQPILHDPSWLLVGVVLVVLLMATLAAAWRPNRASAAPHIPAWLKWFAVGVCRPFAEFVHASRRRKTRSICEAVHKLLVLLLVLATALGPAPLEAALASDQWNVTDQDGVLTPLNWFDAANWLNGNIPNDDGSLTSGFTADFSRNPLAVGRQLITLDQEATIGRLLLGDLTGNGSYRFTGVTGVPNVNNVLAFAATAGLPVSIEKRSGGNDVIENNIKLWNSDFNVSVLTSATSLTLAGRMFSQFGTGVNVNKYGGGTLRVTHDLTGNFTDFGSWGTALQSANLGAGSAFKVFGGTLETGNSWYTAPPSVGTAQETWSSVFGERNSVAIELYGAQLNVRNNGASTPSAAALQINYGNNIRIVRDSVINLGQFSAGYTNRSIRFGQLRVGDATVVVNTTNGYSLRLDSLLVEGSAARVFSNQNIFVETMSGDASLNKFGAGTLTITGATTFSNGINVLQGVVWADNAAATAAARVIVSPNTRLDISFQAAVPGNRGSDLFLTSSVNSANPGFGVLSIRNSAAAAPANAPWSSQPRLDFTATDWSKLRLGPLGSVLGLNNGTYIFDIDQSKLGNGKNVFIGATGNTTLAPPPAPTAAAPDPPPFIPWRASVDGIYRFGANASAATVLTITAPDLLINGATSNSLMVGMPIARNTQNGTGIAYTTGTVTIDRNQNYSGITTVFTGSTISLSRSAAAADVGNRLGTGTTVNILGTLSTTNQNYAPNLGLWPTQLAQTIYNIYGGGLFDINNTGVVGTFDNHRIPTTSTLNLIGGQFRYQGDNVSTNRALQAVETVNAWGQATIDIRRATPGGSDADNLAQVIFGIVDVHRGSASNPARSIISFTNAGLSGNSFNDPLSYLIVTKLNGANLTSPGMLPVYMVNGTAGQYLMFEGSGTYRVSDMPVTAYSAGFTADGTVSEIAAAIAPTAGDSVYALRAAANINAGSSLRIRSGGFLASTNITAAAPLQFNNGTSDVEAIVYTTATGTTSFTNTVAADGLTKGGPGILNLNPGTNNSNRGNVGFLSGTVTINAGTLQVSHQFALGGGAFANPYSTADVPQVEIYGGTYQPNLANTNFLNDVIAKSTSVIAPNAANTKFRHLTIEEMPVPLVVNTANSERSPTAVGTSVTIATNAAFMSGNLVVNAPTLLTTQQNLVVEGTLQGSGSIDKWGNGALALLHGSSGYSGAIRVFQGALQLQDGRNVASQLGAGMIDVMPGAIIRLASPAGIAVGEKAVSSQFVPTLDVNGVLTSVALPASITDRGLYYHAAPKIRAVPTGDTFGTPAELAADFDPVTGRITGVRVISGGSYVNFVGSPTVEIEIDAPGASDFEYGLNNELGGQLAIHSDRAGLGVLSLIYGGQQGLPTGVQFFANNGLYGGVVAIDTVGFTASLNLRDVNIHKQDSFEAPSLYLGSTLGGTYQGYQLTPQGSQTETNGSYYLGGGGGLLNINTSALIGGGTLPSSAGSTVYIGANSNLNVFESLNMALGGGNIAFNNVQLHGNTSIQGGGTLTIGIHGALDQTRYNGALGGLQFNGNTHPVFASSNSAIGLAVLQPSTLLGRATLNPTLTINNDVYFSGDLGVNTNNGNDVVFTGNVYLGNSLVGSGALGASRFFNIGNVGTPGRVYFRGGITDGVEFSGARDNQVIKQGVGVMHMEGSNTYTGNTHILAGFIALTTDNDIPKALSPGQSIFMQGGGLGIWEAAPTAQTPTTGARDATRRFSDTIIIYPQVAGPYGVANSPNGFGIFDVGAGLRFSQYGGSISGGGTLIKQGQGTLVLGANQTDDVPAGDAFTVANAITGIYATGGVLQFNTQSSSGDPTQPSAQPVFFTGTTTAGTGNVTAVGTTTGLAPGMLVTGANIAIGTKILAITGANTMTLDRNVLSAATNGSLRVGGFSFQLNSPVTLTNSSNIITLGGTDTTASLFPGMVLSGTNIPGNATITRILSPTTFEISANTGTAAAGTTTLRVAATNVIGGTSGDTITISLDMEDSLGDLLAGLPISGGSIPTGTLILNRISVDNVTGTATYRLSKQTLVTEGDVNFLVGGIAANIGNGGTTRFNYTNTLATAYSRNMQTSGALGFGIDVSAGNTFFYSGSMLRNDPNLGYMYRKTGAGTLVTSGTNSLSAIEINNGAWRFSRDEFVTTTNGGWGDSARITIAGGEIQLDGAIGIWSTNLASSLTFSGGGALNFLNSSVTVAATDLIRSAQGTLLIKTVGSLGGASPVDNRFNPTNTFFNGVNSSPLAAAVSSAGVFSAFLLHENSNSNTADFLTIGANGFVVPSAGAFIGDINSGNEIAIGNFTTPQTIAAGVTRSMFAFKTTADVSGGRISITSVANTAGPSNVGGIIFNGNATISSDLFFNSDPGPLVALNNPNANSGEGLIYVAPNVTGTLTGDIFARGLTKFGGGNLVLAGANEILGNLTVQAGTLTIGATGTGAGRTPLALGTTFATPLVVNSTGVLDLNGVAYSFDSLGTTGGAAGGVITNSRAELGELIINGMGNSTLNIVRTGTAAASTAIITGLSATSDLYVGQSVFGLNVPAGTFITGITNSGAITLSNNVSAAIPANTPITFGSIYEGRITGNVKLTKVGLGMLTLGGFTTANPDAGNNTYTGGTEIQGGTLMITNPLALGGADNDTVAGGAGSVAGKVELFGGTLRVRINGGNNNGVIVIGNQNTAGINVDLNASSTLELGNLGATTGNAVQIGDLRLSGATLTLNTFNNYYLKVAGTTRIGDGSAGAWTDLFFNTNNAVIEIAGRLVGDGLIYKRDSAVNGVLRTLVITGTNNGVLGGGGGDNNGFRGNILVAGGALQITGNTGNPIGTGTVTVLPAGQLRVAGNNSLGAGTLRIGSQVNAWAGIGLDGGFNPTFLTNPGAPKTAFGSMYGTLLQITTPFFNQVLNMANVGDGRAFVAPGIAAIGATFEAGLNPTPAVENAPGMLPGVADSFVAGQPVYRLSGNANLGATLALVGVDNTLQNVGGATFLQIGPIANNFLSVANVGAIVTGTGGNVIFRQANNYTGGTQIVRSQGVILDIGAFGGSALGTGDVEVFGALTLGSGSATGYGGVASFVNPSTGTNYNNIVLRPGGQIVINDVAGEVAGGQGRWADAVPLNLNGGTFAFLQGGGAAVTNGAVSTRSYEKIGAVTASKGGALRVVRAAGAGQAVLELSSLTRADGTGGTQAMDRGTLLITNSAAINGTGAAATSTLGVVSTGGALQPTNYDRLIVTGGIAGLGGLSGTTSNGSQVVRPGVAPLWIVDATSNSYMTYNPTNLDGDTGFQPLVSTTSPGFGQVGYARVIAAGALSSGSSASGEVIDITGAQTVNTGSTVNWYAARIAGSITFNTGAASVINFAGGDARYGGLLFSATSVVSGAATANLPNNQSTLAFNAKEAVIYTANGVTATINSQITQSAGGLTKFGQGVLVLAGSNTLSGTVVVNGGTLQLNNPYSGTGSLINDAVNGQTIVLNGNGVGTGAGQAGTTTLVIDNLLANNAGNRDSIFATSVLRVTRTMASAIHVRGDSTITNNNQTVVQKITSLTVADLGVRSPVTTNFSTGGITVAGATTLGANSNAVNVSFGNLGLVSFDGQVTGGAGGRLFKTGNGLLFLNSGTNSFGSSAAGAIGLEVWGSTQNTATSIVGTTFRGTGTPFGVGDINLLPGSMIRLADAANISSQIVNAYSDILGIAGVSFAYHNYDSGNLRGLRQSDILNMLTTGTATDGKVRLSTTGNYLGVISLDNGWQYGALDLAAMEAALGNGKIWLGASTSNQVYFAPSLAPNSGNVYRLGGGGNQGSLILGGNGFENLLTGANNVVAGANDFGFNAVSYINGNFSLTLRTRNNLSAGTTFTAERDTTVNIENAFALGAAKLIVNHASDVSAGGGAGGLLQTNNGNMAINNNVDFYGDLRYNGNNDLTIRGNVNLTPTGFGGTRVIQAGTGGAGILSITGIVSGDRSNLVKSGAGNLMLGGLNTYTGTTQLAGTGGNLLVSRNVLPNTPGPLGNSDSPVLITAGSATLNAIGLGLSGQVTFGRDVIVQLAAGTLGVSVYGNTNYTSRFTGGIAVGVPLTGTTEVALQSAFGGRFEMLGTITSNAGVGSMRVRIGDIVAPTGGRTGTVYFGAGPNGTSLNNYVGNTILDVARIVVGTNSQFAGSGDSLQITSSPFGIGTIQLASTTNGTFIGSDGANREIPNTLATSSVAGNVSWTFEGRGNLVFRSDVSAGWNVNSDGSLRNRAFVVNTSNGFIQFDTDVNASGAGGVNLLKQGQGVLVMNGAVSSSNRVTTDGNYGTGWFIDAGTLRVTSDLSLGSLGGDLATGAGMHDAGAPADIRLRSASGTTLGGTLSIGGDVTTGRKIIFAATSGTAVMAGIEVAAGRTFTVNNSLVMNTGVTAATLVKSGRGTMVLNGGSSNITGLQIGGINGGGGVVRTSVSGNPLVSSAATSRVTIAGGTLELVNTGSAYNISIPRLSYSSGSYLQMTGNAATTTLNVTDANVDAFQRLTSGMLTIVADALGSTQKVLINAAAAPANTSNQILAIPSVVTRTTSGTDLNFVRYDATNGFMTHNMPSQSGGNVNTFNGLNSGMVAEFNPGAPILGPAAATTMYALRTNNNIGIGATMTITSGGLIMNGPGLIIDAPMIFGASASTPGEALVWVSNPAASSQISGRFTALNFTKAGPGTLVLANNTGINSAMVPLSDAGRSVNIAGNIVTGDTRDLSIGMSVTLGSTTAIITDILSVGASGRFVTSANLTAGAQSVTVSGLRRMTIQDGTLKFANQAAVPQTLDGASSVVMAIGDTGTFDLNGQQISVGGLVGTGSIANSISNTLARLTVSVDATQAQSTGMVFNGSINGNLEFVKSGIGTLVIGSPINADGATYVNTFTGGTYVDAGQIIGAHNFAPSALGTLSIRTVNALGTGKITLRGGTLDLSMTGTGSSGYAANQIIDGFSVIQVGPGDGYDIDVAATTNFGAASPNTTSALSVSLASPTAWSKINNVNLYGRALTWTGTQNTNVLVAGRFDASLSSASRVFLNTINAGAITGQLYAPGKTLVKAGAQTLFLTNTSTTAPNIVGGWEIYAGSLELRQSDGGSSPLGGDTSILLNGATFNIRLEGDNTNTMQMLRTFAGNSIVVGSSDGIGTATYAGIGAAVISTDRLGGGANKTVVMKDLRYGGPVGSAMLTYNAGNAYSLQFTNLLMDGRDAYMTPNANLTIAGAITSTDNNLTLGAKLASGTLVKQGSGNLFINGDNTSTFRGGTVITAGTVFFGKFEGVMTSLSDSPNSVDDTPGDPSDDLRANSNLGEGHVLVNPGAAIQFNSLQNRVANWTGMVDLRGNLMNNYGMLRLAVNAPLSEFNVRFGNLGGVQDGTFFNLLAGTGYRGIGKNNGSAIIALNTVYTQTLNMARLGDGTAFLGSTTNGVGLNGSYNAATLGVGAGNLYRLGAGGSTLYIAADMANANILTGTAGLVVGMPQSSINNDNLAGGNGRGIVVLMTSNNYTGATTVNRGSTLEFRGGLATSSFTSYGVLSAAGLGGTFLNSAGTANRVAVTLMPTAELRFDNSSGLLPNTAAFAQGRWADAAAINLSTNALRLIGNRDVEVLENVGDVTYAGGSQIFVQRDYVSRRVTLRIGGGAATDLSQVVNSAINGFAITGNNGTLQINPATGGQLGSDERVMLVNGLSGGISITNGMIAPWIINATENQFLTYTAENGFINAGFNATRSGAFGTTPVSTPTDRTQITAAASMAGAGGLILDTYALRLDNSFTFAVNTTAEAADRLRIRSGALIVNGAFSIIPGLEFGAGSATQAYIYNNNTLVIGSAATAAASTTAAGVSPTTTGQITGASHIIKSGAGQLQIESPQPGFTGNWIVNQGNLMFRSATSAPTTLGGAADGSLRATGAGGWVVFNGHDSQLLLRGDQTNTTFNVGLALGYGVTQARITADRALSTTTTGLAMVVAGGIRMGGSPGEQGQTLVFSGANSYTLTVNGTVNLGPTTLDGSPAFAFIRAEVPTTLNGLVTGGGVLVKTGGSNLDLTNITAGLNDFGALQIIQGGTLTVRAYAPIAAPPLNYAAGVNSVITNGGLGNGTVTLWGGALALLYDVGSNDATRQRFWIGNGSTGNSLVINGSANITVNRNAATRDGIATATTTKQLAFRDMTIGSQTLTIANGNSYYLEINGKTNLVATPVLNTGSPLVLFGGVDDGGSRAAIVKMGGSELWINAASSFGGLFQGALGANGIGLVVNGGLVRFGDGVTDGGVVTNLNTIMRGSTMRVNPTGNVYITNPTNVTFGTGQLQMLGSAPQLSVFRLANAGFSQTYLQNALSGDSQTVLGMEATFTAAFALDLATIGNGCSFLAAQSGARSYVATSLGVGADGIYRLGGLGQALTLTTGVLVGAGNKLQVGSQATNVAGTVILGAQNTYTGGTIVSRSNVLQFTVAANATGHALGTGQVDVFGTLLQTGSGSFLNFAGSGHQNTIVLHPGSTLRMDLGTTTVNRWADNVPINLDGAMLQVTTGAASMSETVGAISFSRHGQVFLNSNASGQLQVNAPSLTRNAGGTLLLTTTAASQLGSVAAAGNRLVISGGAGQITGGSLVNGMLPAYYVNATDNTFVTYGANGFANFTGYTTVAGGDLAATTITASTVLNVNTTGSNPLNLVGNLTLYALRTNQSILSGAGQYNKITFSGNDDVNRGGIISQNLAVVLGVDLQFGDNGDREGIIYVNNNTLTIQGDIYTGSLTKFGSNTLIMAKDQTADARGSGGGFTGAWTVNQGNLQLNTFGASGTGPITLNPSLPTTAAGTTLLLRAIPGSALNGQYTMGKITMVDNAIIDVNANAADTTVSVNDLDVHSTDTTGLSPARARFVMNQQRSILGINTLTLTGTGGSIIDVNATALNNVITAGVSAGVTVNALGASANDLIKWGNGVLYLRGNNTSYTGNVYVEQGVLSVTTPGALAGAGSITVRRYGALEIFTTGFNRAVTYEAGSVERWSAEGARSGAVNLGAATLQVANDQFSTTAQVTLNGGSIEGFLRADDVLGPNNGAVYRTLGANVSIILAGNSFIGQDPLFGGPNGLNNGRTPDYNANGVGTVGSDLNTSSNLTESVHGVILEIKGNITETGGARSLSKQSLDTVILSGANSYTGGTNIGGGTLRITSTGGLAPGSDVRMYGPSILDISVDDTTAESSVPVVSAKGLISAKVSGEFVSSAGFITNSSTRVNTLRIGAAAAVGTSTSFGGVIQNNLNLEKVGPHQQVLSGANTYFGSTNISGGTLTVDGSIAGSGVTVASGGRLNGGVQNTPGVVSSPIVVQSGGSYSAGSNTFNANTGNGVGQMNVTAGGVAMQWDAGAEFTFDFNAMPTGGAVAGTNWDYVNIVGGTLKINASLANTINVFVDAWNTANTAYGANNLSATPGGTYQWLWVTANNFVDANDAAIADGTISFFNVQGDGPTGVFSPGGANYGGTIGSNFWVSRQGTSLFVNYNFASVPEPSSLLLIGVAGLGLAGYRRRRKKAVELDQPASPSEE